MVLGALIIFFLIAEPNGLARLWQVGKTEAQGVAFPLLKVHTLAMAVVPAKRAPALRGSREPRPSNRGRCEHAKDPLLDSSSPRINGVGRNDGNGKQRRRETMRLRILIAGLSVACAIGSAMAVDARAQEGTFIPLLTYRTGPFAVSGTPIANGMHDYFTMLNERDGGIGGFEAGARGMRDRLQERARRRMLRFR